MKKQFKILVTLMFALLISGCSVEKENYEVWLTDADKEIYFQNRNEFILSDKNTKELSTIVVNPEITYQSIDGFGFTLNGGSARLIHEMDSASRKVLLTELYGRDKGSIGVNYIRLSVAASDLSDSVFTYNDLPAGHTDEELEYFNMEMEHVHLIPILKEIIAINPDILIMGSPWSAPAWMKTNNSLKGGSLNREYFEVYANYLVKYIQEMEKEGIVIDALTIQNEPLHPGNNPSMFMSAEDQAIFIKQNLGPAFEKASVKTKILIYDHNADHIEYPISILNDAEANKYVDGSAFHLYGGQIDALSEVHEAHPDKNIYFTEQWVGAPSNFKEDFNWHINNLIIGATRNWCKTVLEWNLAADENQGPHTDDGGCTRCLGAITIEGSEIERNTAYYIVAHASKFVPTGSVRIESNIVDGLANVAFKTPEGKIVVIVQNTEPEDQKFHISTNQQVLTVALAAEAVATIVIN